MKKILLVFCVCLSMLSCSSGTYHTQDVAKPRIHKGWYKDHIYHRKIGVGRVRIHWFEKQGTKTVRMKG